MKEDPQEAHDLDGLSNQDSTNNTVNIPPETDLNNALPVPSQKWDKDLCEENRYFPEEVYENLPELYQLPSHKFPEPKDKDMLLLGQLGVVSGMLPNIIGTYDGKPLQPNLFVYILGPFGEGKGTLNWAKKLGDPVDMEKLALAKELMKEYNIALAKHKKDLKQYEQGKRADFPEPPESPPILKLFIPGNIGKSGLLQILQDCGGNGILFEPEADTLASAIKSEHGDFSDILRKTYSHESVSFFRRTNNEDVNITNPALSVILSSTHDQLRKLIQDIENGLFSRFLYFHIPSSPEFKDVFDDSKRGHNRYFMEIGEQFKKFYDFLTAQPAPFTFELSSQQQKRFLTVFQDYKNELREQVSPYMGGIINRLAISTFRIAMQLTIVRALTDGHPPHVNICTDQDFNTALQIINTLIHHMVFTFKQYPQYKYQQPGQVENSKAIEAEQIRQCRELRANGTPIREIAKIVLGDEGRKSTVERWTK